MSRFVSFPLCWGSPCLVPGLSGFILLMFFKYLIQILFCKKMAIVVIIIIWEMEDFEAEKD